MEITYNYKLSIGNLNMSIRDEINHFTNDDQFVKYLKQNLVACNIHNQTSLSFWISKGETDYMFGHSWRVPKHFISKFEKYRHDKNKMLENIEHVNELMDDCMRLDKVLKYENGNK